jgi:alanine racemase
MAHSSVVKGNAYGHGIEIFVPLAEDFGVRHFSVYSAEEGYRVFKSSLGESRVMIMGMLANDQLEWAIENEIEFFVFDLDRLDEAIVIAGKVGKPAHIHLELETGMNRTGLFDYQLADVAAKVKAHPNRIVVEGVCTHFAGSESLTNYFRIRHQQVEFRKRLKQLQKLGLSPKKRHTVCSAGVMRYPHMYFDMARVGIMQYGFFPSREVWVEYSSKQKAVESPLNRLISWKTKVMDVKSVKGGEYIGYGTSYLANNDMRIALIPVGYGYGYSRSLSNQGRVLIREQRLSVIGTVNMNMIPVDVTHAEGVEKGDEVVLIGNQGDQEISVSSFGDFSDQVNYELLTRLPIDIPRVVVD